MILMGIMLGFFYLIPIVICLLIMGMVAVFLYKILSAILNQFKTPAPVVEKLTENEVATRFRENDLKQNGFNPMRQDWHEVELFGRPKIDLNAITGAQVKLFGKVISLPEKMPIGDAGGHKRAYKVMLALLVHREKLIESGQWTTDREKLWQEFPHRPEQMKTLCPHFYTFIKKDTKDDSEGNGPQFLSA